MFVDESGRSWRSSGENVKSQVVQGPRAGSELEGHQRLQTGQEAGDVT